MGREGLGRSTICLVDDTHIQIDGSFGVGGSTITNNVNEVLLSNSVIH